MPRQARVHSESGIYHVMQRGNEKKDIFIDREDKEKIIEILFNKKEKQEYALYAYCIMDNHFHLVMKEESEPVSQSLKKISVAYARYFNKKYNRVGHVFQDRFRSENIEDERYLLAVIRYVHQNPVKAGISMAHDYPWSSYRLYVGGPGAGDGSLPEVEYILNFFSDDRAKAIKYFKEFVRQDEEQEFMDIDMDTIDETNITSYLNDYLAARGLDLQTLLRTEHKHLRDTLIRDIVNQSSLSLRRIAELTGISREMIRRAVKR